MSAEDRIARIDAQSTAAQTGSRMAPDNSMRLATNPTTRKATGNVGKNPQGPTEKLINNPYNIKDLRFPSDVGNNPGNRHWIKFIPLIQQKGRYDVKTQPGAADLGGTPRGIPGVGAALGGLAALGVAEKTLSGDFGILDKAAQLVGGITGAGSVANAIKAGQQLAGAGVSVGAQLGLAATILSGISLSRKTTRAASYISLYMPDTVNFTTVNDYDTISLTQALGKAGLAGQAGSDLGSLLTGEGGLGSPGLREAAGTLGEQTGLFGPGITDVLLFSAGLAQNPQMEVLFKATRNREFLFDFKFAPKTPAESQAIKNIIGTFRFHAAPQISEQGARYFIPPDEFDIEFMFGSGPNPNLPKISSCALEGIDVNYASAGQWATFRDGSPVEIAMQLRFKEVEVLNKQRIADGF